MPPGSSRTAQSYRWSLTDLLKRHGSFHWMYVLWGQNTALQDGTHTLLSLDFSPEAAAAVAHGNVTHHRRRHSVTWRKKKSRYRQGIKPETPVSTLENRAVAFLGYKVPLPQKGWLFGRVWTLLMCSRLYLPHHPLLLYQNLYYLHFESSHFTIAHSTSLQFPPQI